MDWKTFFYSAGAFLIAVALLWLLSLPRSRRHCQRALPLMAMALCAAAVWVYVHPVFFVQDVLNQTRSFLNQYGGLHLPLETEHFSLLYNLIVLLLFVVVKLCWSGVTIIFDLFVSLCRSGRRLIHRSRSVPQQKPPRLQPAYDWHIDRGVFLKDACVYPGQYFRFLAMLTLTGLIGTVFVFLKWGDLSQFPLLPPALPSVPLLLLLEFGFYLGGTRPFRGEGTVKGQNVRSTTEGCFADLWKKYRAVWEGRILAEDYLLELPMQPVAMRSTPLDDQDVELDLIAHSLSEHGMGLDPANRAILKKAWEGRDLILIEPVFVHVAPIIFAVLQRELFEGRNILFLVPPDARWQGMDFIMDWIKRGFSLPAYVNMTANITDGVFDDSVVAVAPVTQLIDQGIHKKREWLSKLRCVVVVNIGETFFSDISSASILCKLLADKTHHVQFLALATHDRQNLESAARDFFGFQPLEYSIQHHLPRESCHICWRCEGLEAFQNRVLQTGRQLGCALPLLLPALDDGVEHVLLTGARHTAWAEGTEEIDKRLSSCVAAKVISNNPFAYLGALEDRAVVIGNDEFHLLPAALETNLALGKQASLALISASYSLLRLYFAENLHFFIFTRAFLCCLLAPSPLHDKTTIAYALAKRMMAGFLPRQDIETQLRLTGISKINDVEEEINNLFKDVFECDVFELSLVRKKSEDVFENRQTGFKVIDYYSLSPDFDTYTNSFENLFKLIDSSDKILAYVPADHVFQLYLPKQIHAFAGEPFIIVDIDEQSKKIVLEHCSQEGVVEQDYLPEILIDLYSLSIFDSEKGMTHGQQRGIFLLSEDLCRANYSIRTTGYHILPRQVSTDHPHYERLDGDQFTRNYKEGRLLRLTISSDQNTSGFAKIEATLAVLFQGVITTLFPDTHRFLHVAGATGFNTYSPPFSPARLEHIPDEGTGNNQIRLYFFEDSTLDMGLVKALHDEFDTAMDVIEDFLSWLLSRDSEKDLCGYDKLFSEFAEKHLDLPGCLALLKPLLEQRTNRLFLTRQNFINGADQRPGVNQQRACDFCGNTISASSYERLSDGRDRCGNCKKTAVNTSKELRRLYSDARKWFVTRFGYELRNVLSIEFTSAEEVHRAQGEAFTPTADFDARSIGFARRHGDTYSIYIENGQPYHMTLGTVVHELTHIWQYSYLDMEKMEREYGDLLIEGHAMWTELACLENRRIASEYCQRQKARSDVYGKGYHAIIDLMAQNSADNPFLILIKMFHA